MTQARWDYMEYVDSILGTKRSKQYRKTKKAKRSIITSKKKNDENNKDTNNEDQ